MPEASDHSEIVVRGATRSNFSETLAGSSNPRPHQNLIYFHLSKLAKRPLLGRQQNSNQLFGSSGRRVPLSGVFGSSQHIVSRFGKFLMRTRFMTCHSTGLKSEPKVRRKASLLTLNCLSHAKDAAIRAKRVYPMTMKRPFRSPMQIINALLCSLKPKDRP